MTPTYLPNNAEEESYVESLNRTFASLMDSAQHGGRDHSIQKMSETYNKAFGPEMLEQVWTLYKENVDAVSEISEAGRTVDGIAAEPGSARRTLWEDLYRTVADTARSYFVPCESFSSPPTRIPCDYSEIPSDGEKLAVSESINQQAAILRKQYLPKVMDSFLLDRKHGAERLAEEVAKRMSRRTWPLEGVDTHWHTDYGDKVFLVTVQSLVYSPPDQLERVNPDLPKLMSLVNRSGRQRRNDWMADDDKVQMVLNDKKQMAALTKAVALVLNL